MKRNCLAIFLLALSSVLLELLMTRIWSVTLWYHFAFVAISITMFGMTAGALLVQSNPKFLQPDLSRRYLALLTLGCSISIVFGFLSNICIPIFPEKSLLSIYSLLLFYLFIAIPFFLVGAAITILLTQSPDKTSQIYACDLCGAAFACIAFFYALKITDGPTAVLCSSIIAGFACFVILFGSSHKVLLKLCSLWLTAIIFVTGANFIAAANGHPLIKLAWVKAELEEAPLYEKWNSYSRLTVSGDPDIPKKPLCWGTVEPPDYRIKELSICLDSLSATVMTNFGNNLANVDYLKGDVTAIGHYLRPNASVLSMGVGGGRDILSALVFKQKSIKAVEINEDVIYCLNKKFGNFSGHLDNFPNVQFIVDEARSYLSRSKDKYDIIQFSLISTASTTGAGAFALTENSLYTVECWLEILKHLKDDGIACCSRFYFYDMPAEVYRLTSLARAALIEYGIEDPENHIVVVCEKQLSKTEYIRGMSTLIMSKKAFSQEEIALLKSLAERHNFTIAYARGINFNPTLTEIAQGKSPAQDFPIKLQAPTDDSPFFFYMLKPQDLFRVKVSQIGTESIYSKAAEVLVQLFVVIGFLTFLVILIPLITMKPLFRKAGAGNLLAFTLVFSSLGCGFMLVEVSQLQRLSIFLGHPSYGLTCVLFSLLLSTGLGSLLSNKLKVDNSTLLKVSLAAVGVLLAYYFISPGQLNNFRASANEVRGIVSILLLFPVGLILGMLMPLSLRYVAKVCQEITPWLWAVNGATSTLASVVSVLIAVNISISAALISGIAFYVLVPIVYALICLRMNQTQR